MMNSDNFYATAFWGRCFTAIAVFSLTLMTLACAGRPPANKMTFADTGASTVAVMPAKNTSGNDHVARMLREKVIETVYFKGYRKLPARSVDDAISKDSGPPGGDKAAAQRLSQTLGVDALLYITLSEAAIKEYPLHMTIDVAATFELVATRSGQSLWKSRQEETERGFALTRAGQSQAAHLILEGVVERLIEKGFSSFPEGPILAGGTTKRSN